jgi:hypothetical protein
MELLPLEEVERRYLRNKRELAERLGVERAHPLSQTPGIA